MKQFFIFLTIMIFLSLTISVSAYAEKNCICVEGVEFLMEEETFNPPKIEKLQILGLLKKSNFENVMINFYDKFKGHEFEGAQVEVTIVTEAGEKFEGAARVNKGQFNTGLARAVKDALNPS